MEILQFIPDIKGRKCPIHSIKAWFLTTDYDTNTGRIEFSCMPNASCRVNYLPTSFSMPLSSVLLDSIETQASSFQISSCCFAPKINNNKTDSQYFHPTWPQKVFLEMYLQPKPKNRTPKKKNTRQHPKEQVSNQPFDHNGTWAFVQQPHLPDAPCGKDVTRIKSKQWGVSGLVELKKGIWRSQLEMPFSTQFEKVNN